MSHFKFSGALAETFASADKGIAVHGVLWDIGATFDFLPNPGVWMMGPTVHSALDAGMPAAQSLELTVF